MKNQAIVVSKDKGTQREHHAINSNRRFDLRHYELDGDVFKQMKRCDFLLINVSKKKPI